MTTWQDLTREAPRITTIFARRLATTDNLCMLATLRRDGYPRISPIEPRVFEGELWLTGMPGTTKFRDLARDPRLCLHTATVDSQVHHGDAKLWGLVQHVPDPALHQRFAVALFEETGFDLRGSEFEHFYAVDVTGASAVEVAGGHLDVTIWTPHQPEHVVRKH